MKHLASLIVTTATLVLAAPAMAGVYKDGPSDNKIFTWGEPGIKDDGTNARDAQDKLPDGGLNIGSAMRGGPDQEPKNPLMRDYPSESAPEDYVPAGGTGRYFDGKCDLHPNAPRAWARSYGVQDASVDFPMTAALRRRGEMVGDDGTLEAIQDDPCVKIWRRGGPSAESINEYTHPSDIRRVNTLEVRRIPVHDVVRAGR